jgi:hypothetical protein
MTFWQAKLRAESMGLELTMGYDPKITIAGPVLTVTDGTISQSFTTLADALEAITMWKVNHAATGN